MNEKCKYCDYVSKCSRICEYNSVMCRLNRSFPKIVDKSYEELQQENQRLEEQDRNNTATLVLLNDENKELKEQLKNIKFDLEYEKENLKFSKDYAECLKDKLKQRDEVIDETIGMLDKLDTDIMQNTIIGFQQFLPRFYEIKEILQRYRGDNK